MVICEYCAQKHTRPSRWCSKSCRDKQYYRNNKEASYRSQRNWAKKHPEKLLEYNRKYAIERRDKMREWGRKHGRDPVFRVKHYARRKAQKYIKIPEGQLCEECNILPATERDHRDYSKPLEVKLVCRQCNVNLGEGKLPDNI